MEPWHQHRHGAPCTLCIGGCSIYHEGSNDMHANPCSAASQIDLDTIETSNLNRQFLFRKHHVGQSKARTAAEVVK